MTRPIRQIVRSLGRLSKKWLDKNFEFRQKALRALNKKCGYSPAMSAEILDDLFSELSAKKLWALLESELGNPEVLDKFCDDKKHARKIHAFGPGNILHIFSANAPNPSVVSVVLGLLTKSVNHAKISSEDSGLLDLYLKSLRRHDPILARACRLIRGRESKSLKKALLTAGAVIVYGGPESVRYFHQKTSPAQIFIPYGHRMSFSIYLKAAFSKKEGDALSEKTARDLWLMNQEGCLSPLIIFIQMGEAGALDFCRKLSRRLKVLEKGASLWRIFYEDNPSRMPAAWGGRKVYVKSFRDARSVYATLRKFSPYLQAATLEGSAAQVERAADALAVLGFNRICRAGRIQKPPLSWHHDGRMNLAPLLRWTDLEGPS